MKIKRITIYSMLFFYLIILCGCSQEKKEVTIQQERPAISLAESDASVYKASVISGQDYENGAPLKVLEANGLTITQVSSDPGSLADPTGSYYVYDTISGLSKESIENKINNMVSEAVLSWVKDKPMTEEYPEDDFSGLCIDGACYGACTSVTWNYCDYISGVLTRTIDYYEPSAMTHSRFTYISPLNFDLRTGEAFTLKALFTNDCDYMSVISRAVLQYGKDNGLSMTGFMGLTHEPAFCLSETGLVIYTDDTYEKLGLQRNTAVTVSFDNFGNGWAIGRPCDLTIYKDPGEPSYSLLLQKGNAMHTDLTPYYDEGERLQVDLYRSFPDRFPESVFADAERYVNINLPSPNEISTVRKDETAYLKLHFTMEGTVIGNYYCVTLTGKKEQNDEDNWSAKRFLVYDSNLNAVSYSALFSNGFDSHSLLEELLATLHDEYTYGGYLFETEIDPNDTDFILDTQEIRFVTNPVKLTKIGVSAEGADIKETIITSLECSVSYDEIGIGNLTIFGQ